MNNRRQALIGLGALALAPASFAQGDWPNRMIRLIVPFTPGSPPDVIARALLPKMSEQLGQTVIVENKPGATTVIGSEFVARSAPDGYTLLLTATGAPSLFPAIMKLRYDPIKDLPPLGLVVTSQQVFLSGGPNRAKTLGEFIERARQNPGKATIGSLGLGTTNHLLSELLKKAAAIQATYVPYPSGQAAMQALLSGDIDLLCTDVGVMLGFATSDKVSALAVAGQARSEFLPSTPTLAESGVAGVVSANRFALFVPAGVPREIFARLSAALVAAVHSDEAGQAYRKMGMTPSYTGPEGVAEIIRSESAAMVPLARALNLQLN